LLRNGSDAILTLRHAREDSPAYTAEIMYFVSQDCWPFKCMPMDLNPVNYSADFKSLKI